jgi:hypothetical protein
MHVYTVRLALNYLCESASKNMLSTNVKGHMYLYRTKLCVPFIPYLLNVISYTLIE